MTTAAEVSGIAATFKEDAARAAYDSRPLTVAERYMIDAGTEIAFTRQRREIAISEADAARQELVGIEYKALALSYEARRARMPRVLPPRAQHGDLRQAADGTAGANLTGAPLVIGGSGEEAFSLVTVAPHRPARVEMGAPPPPVPPTSWQRFVGWVTGKPPEGPAAPVLKSYGEDELPPGSRGRADQTAYSLEKWGLTPRKTASSPDDAFAKRAVALGGLLREAK